MILHVLIAMVAGWLQRHQQQVITYLLEENRGLSGILRGVKLLYYQLLMSTYRHSNILRSEPAVRQTFEIPLDIPDVTIENVTTNRIGHIEITVKSTVEGTPCHRCGKMTTQFYGEDREITVRHLPILGRKTFIRLRPKRYQCLHCHGNPTTTQTLSWSTPRSSFTKAYEKQILLSLVNSTVQDTSIKEDIGYEAIMGIIDRYIERDIHWEDVTR